MFTYSIPLPEYNIQTVNPKMIKPDSWLESDNANYTRLCNSQPIHRIVSLMDDISNFAKTLDDAKLQNKTILHLQNKANIEIKT